MCALTVEGFYQTGAARDHHRFTCRLVYHASLAAGFCYRVNISWWIFASAGLLSLIIALLVIGFQTARSAIANPANSLRTEQKTSLCV